VICLQETRQPVSNTIKYTFHNKNREDSEHKGGGIAIGVHKNFVSTCRNDLIPATFKSQEIQLVHAASPILQMFIISFYFSPREKRRFNSLRNQLKHGFSSWLLAEPVFFSLSQEISTKNETFSPRGNNLPEFTNKRKVFSNKKHCLEGRKV
jgi:exonuclease III